MNEITFGDFLAGGGGVTEAASQINNLKVRWILNHDKIAIRTNMFNHKGVKHFHADMYKQDEHEMEQVDFVWASIECTQHSKANGGKTKKIGSYILGWELLRYTKHIDPFVIGIENVPEFKKWSPIDKNGNPIKEKKGHEFEKWKNEICSFGYDYHELICNAADYGLPTRRIRYFAFFTKKHLQMQVNWPTPTHNKNGENGLIKWVACKNYINLVDNGNSIFGRKYNPDVHKGKRHPLSNNTLKRIAGGIKKYAPELYFILHYYSSGNQHQNIKSPLNTITTKERHALVKLEKIQFADHCYTDNYNTIDEPLRPQLTRQDKRFVTVENKLMVQHYSGIHASKIEDPLPTITSIDHNALVCTKAQFIADYYGRFDTAHSLNGPANTITTENSKHLVSCKFLSHQYNSNGNPAANNQSIDEPVKALTTEEKVQFITAYFSSGGNQQSQNQDINNPLNAITTGTNKQALITALEKGKFDFDIKMRFLEPEELAQISTFPKGYFTNPLLKLTKKEQVRLIGNAVPPEWAKLIIEPVKNELEKLLNRQPIAV